MSRYKLKNTVKGAVALALTAAVVITGNGISFSGGGAAEAADGQTDSYANVTFTRQSVHDPSIVDDRNGTYYVFGSHMDVAKTTNLTNWQRVTSEVTSSPLYGVVDESGNVVKASFNDAFKENQITGDTGLKDTKGNPVVFGKYDISKWISPYSIQGNQWAPDVIYNDKLGKWCMYQSLNGPDWNCAIVLLTADAIEGPYVYQGPIVFTGFHSLNNAKNGGYKNTDLELVLGELSSLPSKYDKGSAIFEMWGDYWPNGIDPCVFYDDEGNLWMVYGSWSGGIFALELDEATGLRDYSVKYDSDYSSKGKSVTTDEYFGKKIAGGYYVSGEGPYVEKIGKYYYLFMSYGFYAPTTGYNMRVFRSEKPDGPYVDIKGTDAKYTSQVDNYRFDSRGLQLMGNYQWDTMSLAEISQGHNSALYDEKTGNTYLVYHTKFANDTAYHELRVHQLYMNEDGWPVAAPYEYAGESVNDEAIKTMKILGENVAGDYNLIVHQYSNPKAADGEGTVAANVDIVKPVSITLNADGTISGKYTGTWKVTEGTAYVTITIDNTEYKGVFTEQMITKTNKRTICFSAVKQSGSCIWGSKKEYSGSLAEVEPTAAPTDTPEPTAAPTEAPTVEPTAVPTESPATEPTAVPEETPATEPTVVPTETPAVEPTQAPTEEPGEDEEPASSVKVGKQVTVNNLVYKVTSVKGTKAVKLTGVKASAKKNLTKASIPAQIKISGESYKVTAIAPKALKGSKKLKNLTIGKNVSSIGKEAFRDCAKLSKITVATKKLTAKSVGKDAFRGISKKASFIVPKDKVSAYGKLVKAKGADKKVTVKA